MEASRDLLAFGLLAALLYLWRSLGERATFTIPGPFCAQCGYSRHNAVSDRCPECGSRDVAPYNKKRRRWLSNRGLLVAWGIASLMFGWLVGAYVQLVELRLSDKTLRHEVLFRDPASGTYAWLWLSWQTNGTELPADVRAGILKKGGGRTEVVVRPAPEPTPEEFGRALRELYGKAGIGSDDEVEAEVDFVADRLCEIAQGGSPSAAYPTGPFNRMFGGSCSQFSTLARLPENNGLSVMLCVVAVLVALGYRRYRAGAGYYSRPMRL